MESGSQTRAGRGQCRRCGGAEDFGVTVDLSRFYRDSRAHVLVRACGRRRARWLLARVARALALPPRPGLALLAAGRLLPPDEPLRLLRDPHIADIAAPLPLQVIPLPEHWHGYEGLRDFTCSIDSVDAPQTELNSSNRKSTDIQTEQHEMDQESISGAQSNYEPEEEMEREPECEVQSNREPQSNHCNVSLELQRVKERALALLDRCSGAPAGAPAGGSRSPRMRRRRRRRAPAVAASPPPAPGAVTPPASPPPVPPVPPASAAAVPPRAPLVTSPPAAVPPRAPRSPSVRRNRSPSAATTPRLVRALC